MTEQLNKPAYVEGNPKELVLLDVNARYMTGDQFQTLVANVKKDGHLTSAPLVWNNEGDRIVLSGNHRVKAAIAAGIESIGWLEIDQPLERQRQIALQLSHNAVTGQDDPAILKALWEEIESIEWREFAGLDDKDLELLSKVDLSSIGEANLDYLTTVIMFLPHEVERAQEAFTMIADVMSADKHWIAAEDQWGRLVDSLDSARGSHDVVNTAAAFTVLLDVFEANLADLRAGWWNQETTAVKHDKVVPIESVVGFREIPAQSAAIVAQALEKIARDAELEKGQTWRALELLAAEYLAGA